MNGDKKISELLDNYKKPLKSFLNMINQRHVLLIKTAEVRLKVKKGFLLFLIISNLSLWAK